MITRHNSPQKLSGSVDKYGKPAVKKLSGTRAQANPKKPPETCDTPVSAMKSSSPPKTRERLRKVYGWHG